MTYDPRSYWTERARKYGPDYVGPGGGSDHTFKQRRAFLAFIRECMEMRPHSDRLLDFGCGSGRFARVLSRYCDEYVGVDIALPGIEQARAEYPRLRFEHLDGTVLPFPDDHFGAGAVITTFQHIPPEEWEPWTRQLRRVLRDDAPVLVIDELPREGEIPSHMTLRGPEEIREALGRAYTLPVPGLRHWGGWIAQDAAEKPEGGRAAPLGEPRPWKARRAPPSASRSEILGKEVPADIMPAIPGAPLTRDFALILGGADCLWEDLRELQSILGGSWPGLILACNDLGVIWDRRLDHWCTLHAEKMHRWKIARGQKGLSLDGITTWSSSRRTVVDRHFQGWTSGSSGQYTLGVAQLAIKTKKNVCAGIPMDARRNEFSGREWRAHSRYRRGWLRELPHMEETTRSLSGWTQSLLGTPTRSWLKEILHIVPQRP